MAPRGVSRDLEQLAEGRPIITDAYHQVKARLSELVEKMADSGKLRLPSEDQLGALLGVSRPTVRSALLSLQKEGKVQRLHGRGTFINKYALRIRANVGEDRPFLELLTRLGYTATLRTLSLRSVTLSGHIAERLEVNPDTEGCAIERLFEADGRPAVLSVDYVPARLLNAPIDDVHPMNSTFEFLEVHTGHQVQYSVAELIPVVPDETVARHLNIDRQQALLLMRHLHLNDDQRPVAVTEAHVNDAFLRFSVVRTYVGA
ncbi:GntR family transcriptional regulator [Streptosporangium sp. NPDC051022]|uniref:GntR family transcriptional regulator n=1 Tax=Streptosporangium sp. NPDC051022 TaxID=3155752 RepID=UPI00343430BC